MAKIRRIFFHLEAGRAMLQLARPARRRPAKRAGVLFEPVRPLPSPTSHPPCSVGKVEELAARLERGEELWSPDDYVPTDPIMIERYVFNGRRASSYKVAELLASSPRLRNE